MIQNEQKAAVIYCRVSSVKQSTLGDGLRSQETRCREFARMKGYHVVEAFHDDVSGSLIDRPGMKAMLAFIRKRRAKGTVVIIDDVSRLARGLQAHLELRSSIANAGGILESPSIEFGEDSDSVLVENLLASVSQHQRQKNGEQTKNRMRARLMNGYWVFQPPAGYKYERVTGGGRMLKRNEPVASVVQEALEGYALGRFENQADVMRFLQEHPLFPKDRTQRVRHQRVHVLLNQCVYAGYVEAPEWGVSLRVGQHEPLISFQTYQRIQDRLKGIGRAPARKNLNEDFPLRGFVSCGDCGGTLTACWSKGAHSYHPYYLCPKRGCASYGKSIRRDRIEEEFEKLLQTMTPSATAFKVVKDMFKSLWDRRSMQSATETKALGAEIVKIERQVEQLLERILETSTSSVIAAYEQKVQKLEREKLLIQERMANSGRPKSSFDSTLRTALEYLLSPWKLWCSDKLEDKRTVLKLTFANHLSYVRNEGFRTPDLSLPFKLLGELSGRKSEMASPTGFEPVSPP
ncbi:recombinase family protein [Azospirillum fermentarium]|uniref:recombinase family protein n=1 Tax=Azospirillum fermentarium TaxID=1233114 RepID=UPI003872D508